MFTLLLCPLWANAQYTTKYTTGVTDLTSYATTGTNVWKLLGGGGSCLANSLTISYGTLWCIGISDGYAYKFTAPSTWTKQTAMGSGLKGLAVQDANDVWSLQVTSGCTNNNNPFYGYAVFKWSGSAWTLKNGCLVQFQVGADGTLAGVNPTQLWTSPDGGTTWTQLGGNGGWTYASIAASNSLCAVNAGKVYWLLSGAITLFSPQPSGTIAGCALAQRDPVFATWTTTGAVSMLNLTTGNTWQTITGLTVNSIVASQKSSVFALPSTGHPYHWNVYAGYIVGSVSGSLNGCPAPGDPCPPGTIHTASIQVKFPHSLSGTLGSQAGSPTTLISASSWDADPLCDPFFGNPSDPECQATAPTDQVICSATGENLAGGSSPPPAASTYSEYYSIRAGTPTYTGPTPLPGGNYIGRVEVPTADNCLYPSVAVCSGPSVRDTVVGGSAGDVTKAMQEFANTGPYVSINKYNPNVGPLSCEAIEVFNPTPSGVCF